MLVRLMRYAMTGGAAAIVDLVGFRALLELKLPIAVAAASSWLLAAIVNYSLTSRYVFNHTVSAGRGVFFVLVAAIGLFVNVSVTLVCATQIEIDPMLSKVIGIAVAFFLNYSLNALVVFR